jgi:excinuclease ABC subunit B
MAILDADKEGFLRDERSLTQMAGRAARNVDGLVIFYADRITDSMQRTIDETDRRREKQIQYNMEHGIIPMTIKKSVEEIMRQGSVLDIKGFDEKSKYAVIETPALLAAESESDYKSASQLDKVINQTRKAMEKAAKDLDFMEAARLRDELFRLQKNKEAMK